MNGFERLIARRRRMAFTLIELMVVVAIIVILTAVTIPAIKSMTKNNASAQATNLVRSYLSNARSIAISQGRHAGVVFFEETQVATVPGKMPYHGGQTAMQLVLEAPSQTDTAYYDTTTTDTSVTKTSGYTVFVYYSKERQYLPSGMQIATLNDDPTVSVARTAQNSAPTTLTRAIMFDQNGQMVLMNGIACPNPSGFLDGGYPLAYTDWKFLAATASQPVANAASSPGLFIYNGNDFAAFKSTSPTDLAIGTWMQQHADVTIINAYTGGVIR